MIGRKYSYKWYFFSALNCCEISAGLNQIDLARWLPKINLPLSLVVNLFWLSLIIIRKLKALFFILLLKWTLFIWLRVKWHRKGSVYQWLAVRTHKKIILSVSQIDYQMEMTRLSLKTSITEENAVTSWIEWTSYYIISFVKAIIYLEHF